MDCIIFCVDSSDEKRLDLAKKELFGVLAEKELEKTVLLVMANKMDLKNALKIEDVVKRLGLEKIRDRTYSVFKTSAVTGEGLQEAMKWLCANI